MKKVLVVCVVFLLSFLGCNAEDVNATRLYEQKVNSVFFVETQNSSGSGIILSEDGTFVTCFHVIEDAELEKLSFEAENKLNLCYKKLNFKKNSESRFIIAEL